MSLITKEQAATYLELKTPEAAAKMLSRLGVPRVDYSLAGGKGVRYRRSDIDEALAKITVSDSSQKKRKSKKPATDVFDLPVKEQLALLTAHGIRQ